MGSGAWSPSAFVPPPPPREGRADGSGDGPLSLPPGMWQAQVTHQGKPHFLGYFVDEAAAARAYDAKAAELQGTRARFNFPAEWEWERAGGGSTGAWPGGSARGARLLLIRSELLT